MDELQILQVGCQAKDIQGNDLQDQPMRLSDFRGKVVLLVFWATWRGPCMADVPHERELVERFAGRPFVLFGVNGDTSREAAGKAVQSHAINWRSFWNGPEGARGPISTHWRVRGWPTV